MSLESCIAHALDSNLDILDALPEIHDLPVDQLEIYIERYIVEVQESLYHIISRDGDLYLRSKDAAGLCATCLDGGISLPPPTLLKICQTIVELSMVDTRFVLEDMEGRSLYYMRVDLGLTS